MTKLLTTALIVSCLAFTAGQVLAQSFPNKPVRVIVPLTPGSGADIAARVVFRQLGEQWGQPVTIENRPGAGGQIGTQAVVKSPADGYTLLVQSASHAANVAIYKRLPYDPLKDLINVALLGTSPYVMVTSASGPHKNVKDLLAAAKAQPDSLFFASAGLGSSTHLAAESFLQRAGVRGTHIPFKGSPDAIADVISGRTSFYMAPLSTAIGMLKEGKLRPLGVTSPERHADLPDIPTLAEQGIKGYRSELWIGLWAPVDTPSAVARKIHDDVAAALQSPELRAQMAKAGFDHRPMSMNEFDSFVRSEISLSVATVKAAGIEQE